uniref:Uncharacterized protein n=1 Tax=Setaria italica TaxID=4555 RepID=K3Z252_SETIT
MKSESYFYVTAIVMDLSYWGERGRWPAAIVVAAQGERAQEGEGA